MATVRETRPHPPVSTARRSTPIPAVTPAARVTAPLTTPRGTSSRTEGPGASSLHLGALAANFGGPTAESVHLTQNRHPRYNPTGDSDYWNGDCGPASLTMGLAMLGRQPQGTSTQATPQERINRVRELGAAGNTKLDGLTSDGRYSVEEHRNGINYGQLQQAAQASGAQARMVNGFEAVRQAAENHRPVVLLGNPSGEGAYGPRSGIDANDHVVLVNGYDQASRQFTINDPLSERGPMRVSSAELEAFMRSGIGHGWALELSNQ